MVSPLSVKNEEHRYFLDLAVSAGASRLAFFDVISAASIGTFSGVCSDVLPAADLTPCIWDRVHNKYVTDYRRDVFEIEGGDPDRFLRLPCSAIAGFTTVKDVLVHWSGRFGCNVKLSAVWQVWPPVAVLVLRRSWHVLPSVGRLTCLPALGIARDPSLCTSRQVHADHISVSRFELLSTCMRTWFEKVLAAGDIGDVVCSLAFLEEWALWSDSCAEQLHLKDALFKSARGRQKVRPLEVVFASLWISYKLRKDDALEEVVQQSIDVACPRILRDYMRSNLEEVGPCVPSASTLSKQRFCFDCCWTFWWREKVQQMFAGEPPPLAFGLMADSSPMFGRDWFLMA